MNKITITKTKEYYYCMLPDGTRFTTDPYTKTLETFRKKYNEGEKKEYNRLNDRQKSSVLSAYHETMKYNLFRK